MTVLSRVLAALRARPHYAVPPPDASLLAGAAAMLSHDTFRSETAPHAPARPRKPRL